MTLALANNEPIRKAIRTEWKLFENVMILTARTADGSWVLYEPIPDVINDRKALGGLYFKRVLISVEVGGKTEVKEFVRRADFLACALISERFPEFRAVVVEMCERLEDKGFIAAIEFPDDPHLQSLAAAMDTRVRVLRHDHQFGQITQKVEQLESRVSETERLVELANQKADCVAKSLIGTRDWYPLVDWAKGQGIVLDPKGNGMEQGKLIARCCRARGIEPGKHFSGANTYPTEVFV